MKRAREVFIFILLSFLFISLTKNVFDYRKKLIFFESFRQDYEAEQKNKLTLQTQILKNSDSLELEKTIRNNLNLSKEKEVIILVPEPSPAPPRKDLTPTPVYQQWLQAFVRN